MSNFPDVTGTDEGERKGGTPKEEISCGLILGHKVKSLMTVILLRWGAIENSWRTRRPSPHKVWSFLF